MITLGIIGVVAALTIPNILANYKKSVTVNKLKQTYSILKNAERMSSEVNGMVEDWNFDTSDSKFPAYGDLFVKKYYLPYLKSAISCKYENKNAWIKTSSGNNAYTYMWVGNAICLPNGSMIYAGNYGSNGRISGKVIYIDINADKGPNTLGRDIFSAFFGNEHMKTIDNYYYVSCPSGLSFCSPSNFDKYSDVPWDADRNKLIDNCKSKGGNSGPATNSCGYLIQAEGWDIPIDYPVKL